MKLSDDTVLTGETIRALRERLGLTQVEFAALLDAHPITVSRWERPANRHRPSGAYAAALLRLLLASPPGPPHPES